MEQCPWRCCLGGLGRIVTRATATTYPVIPAHSLTAYGNIPVLGTTSEKKRKTKWTIVRTEYVLGICRVVREIQVKVSLEA